ncbi:hypothetical protein [Paenibacillus harenae]|uniref:hypothetical protein n=1 Tax=Paenibacillus harenae TaxID=306543 RepID=UPI00042664F8|nr:hypothetical protein [Paenibacillus harenae]
MKKNEDEKDAGFSELATVESRRNELTAEEFPEGPYGSSIPSVDIGKSTPWRKDQRVSNPYGYENKDLHEDLPREYPPDYEP